MKHITKGAEPTELLAWKALANDDWQPSYEALSGSTKQAVKAALMAEQGQLCCYCEHRLSEHGSHIEHFQPQSDPVVDALDFANLLCSCQNQLRKGEPRHCGNLKGDWFDTNLLVSPLDPNCENCFSYTADGIIHPVDDAPAASETIRRLGLDIPKLNSLRAAAITPFLDPTLSKEEILQFVQGYLARGPDGEFNEYWTTIRYLFVPEQTA